MYVPHPDSLGSRVAVGLAPVQVVQNAMQKTKKLKKLKKLKKIGRWDGGVPGPTPSLTFGCIQVSSVFTLLKEKKDPGFKYLIFTYRW